MTNLARLILSRVKHQCDLCGVSLLLNFVTLGLMAAMHLGDL